MALFLVCHNIECPISTNGISKESKELLAVSKLKDNEELEKMDDELNIIAEHNGKTIPPNDKRRQLMIPSALWKRVETFLFLSMSRVVASSNVLATVTLIWKHCNDTNFSI